uniref:Transcription factor grauzone n=1 Tax=Ceratitis capitata TaxID=7213 RepID=W8AWJ0_CERCA
MICRLCLRSLIQENNISLFESVQTEGKLIKLITKYFHLEITQDDPISTSLCENCSDHLEEFHGFWLFIESKQSSLGSEFLAVKCSEIKEDTSMLIDVTGENTDSQEEILLDLKDISIEQECDENNCDLTNITENIDVAPITKLDLDANTDSQDDWKDDNDSFDGKIMF